ncbi:hypothetical protein J5N97_004494 [Dioscorea zingiberensis]|uniref:Uncharacterized protein n=1 Tax=Dioscorea zingiberensis TaxID=325984 RepID=A0A9D5BV27_9LILI|nr:hypothetical protein J5N97_000930 [Dioscorea zingiberensis]KAJ0986138.1 hypothetical protein J5N97_004494 [Dioscorea zingiberensis]
MKTLSPSSSSSYDELSVQQSLLFSDNLKELKNLRSQLYSAAEHFEQSYANDKHKKIVLNMLKAYVVKALVNSVDHLGCVAYKVNDLLSEQVDEFSGTELRLSYLEQSADLIAVTLMLIETPEKRRAISPHPSSSDILIRSGSFTCRPISRNSTVKRQHPSEPQKSASMRLHVEGCDNRELKHSHMKSKSMLKSLLSRRKGRNEDMLLSYLDEY